MFVFVQIPRLHYKRSTEDIDLIQQMITQIRSNAW
jgi:hypothetical protein